MFLFDFISNNLQTCILMIGSISLIPYSAYCIYNKSIPLGFKTIYFYTSMDPARKVSNEALLERLEECLFGSGSVDTISPSEFSKYNELLKNTDLVDQWRGNIDTGSEYLFLKELKATLLTPTVPMLNESNSLQLLDHQIIDSPVTQMLIDRKLEEIFNLYEKEIHDNALTEGDVEFIIKKMDITASNYDSITEAILDTIKMFNG